MAEISLGKTGTQRASRRFLSTKTRIQIGTLVGVWALWELTARSGLFYKDIVPSSVVVTEALIRQLSDPEFYWNVWVTTYEVVAGFLIGSGFAIALGILLGVRPFLGRVMDNYIMALAPAPKVVFLPILMVLFGIGTGSKVGMAAISAFFPVVLSTVAGMHLVNPVLIKVGRSFNASAWHMVTKIYLPSLVVPVITGLRLGLGVAIIGALIGEIKLSNAGLGFLAIQYYEMFRVPDMYAVIIVIFALAMGANALMTRLNNRLSRRGMPSAEVSGAA